MAAITDTDIETTGGDEPQSMLPGVTIDQVTGAIVYEDWWWGAGQITWSVPGLNADWSGYSAGDEPFVGYVPFNAAQIERFRAAMNAWDELVAATFVETNDATNKGNIRVGFSNHPDLDAPWGYANVPPYRGGTPPYYSGDIWIDDDYATTDFAEGSYDWEALLHEIGHALGMRHTFETNPIPTQWDTRRYSIMSYTDPTDNLRVTFRNEAGGSVGADYTRIDPSTPMVFDIAAIQNRYGADTATRAGNNTYTFDQNEAFFKAIYDAGGVDTLSVANFTRGSLIDLRPGAYSSLGQWSVADQIAYWKTQVPGWAASYVESTFAGAGAGRPYTWDNNFGIAWSTTIENAIGGSAADVIQGNAANNHLQGRGGNDVLSGDAGNDTLDGGVGADRMTGGAGNDTYFVDNAGDVVIEAAGGGTDRVNTTVTWSAAGQDIENIAITGTGRINVVGNDLNNVMTGNDDVNALNGGRGADRMVGGKGNDLYYVDNVGDVVVEAAGEGTDTVRASISYTLGANVERLQMVGSQQVNAIGNALDNVITGNARANIIIGMGGRDLMTGGGGADRFDFRAVSDSPFAAYDRITDLEDQDVINLSAIDANTSIAGDQAFTLVAAFTRQAGQLTLTFNATGNFTVLAADVNGDGVGDFRVILDGDHTDYDNFRL